MHFLNQLRDQTSRIRCLAKALTWRVTATLTTTSITYAVIGEVNTAIIIGGVEFVLKFAIYYFHERAWLFIK
jgi:uncharacterized membrane protein